MGKALKVIGSDVSRLKKSEQQLLEAMADQFEAFYRQGVILKRIQEDREFQDEGFESFHEYMDERQPCGIKQAHAYRLITAVEIRPLLPEFSPIGENSWTEGSIRPLTNKKFSKSDVRRLGKKIATQVRRGESLTAKLVKQICDDDLGITRRKKEKQEDELYEADTPATVLKDMRRQVRHWKQSLEQFSATMWDDAESEAPGCCQKLSDELSDLASYLVS